MVPPTLPFMNPSNTTIWQTEGLRTFYKNKISLLDILLNYGNLQSFLVAWTTTTTAVSDVALTSTQHTLLTLLGQWECPSAP